MRYQTTSAPEFKVGRRRAAALARRGRRFLLIAVILSVFVHLAALVLVVSIPRLLPKDASPKQEGTVELLMVEQKGAQPSQAGQPNDSNPSPPEKTEPPTPAPLKTDPPKKEDSKDEAATPPAPTPLAPGDEAAPPPAPKADPKVAEETAPPVEKPPQKEASAQPLPPRSQQAPVFDLEGTESDSDAVAMGDHILPASRDDRFRNRPPPYPVQAEERGQHGAVTLLIHVSENGVATGVDVLESSGYDVLDQAAMAAVRKWHFHPAMQQGRSIPFDMPFRFIFEAN